MDEPLMKIGEIAAFFDVSVKALRMYEKMGIIMPAKIDESTGYRYYNTSHFQKINLLLELKSLGFSLLEIKETMSGNMTQEQFITALTNKKIVWQNLISVTENKIDAIDSISKRVSDSKASAKLHELTDEQRAELLIKIVCVEDMRVQSVIREAIWL
ncbi:MAG: MerR family transcriptional regulator [Saccharofermentanales bacterium]